MKSLQWLPACVFVFLFSATAVGQNGPALPTQISGPGMIAFSASFGGTLNGVDNVKGNPFSADVAYEFTQVLANENRIHREWHGKIFRDAEGRIRYEVEDALQLPLRAIRRVHITIHDPVSQTSVMLDPLTKRAIVNHFVAPRRDAAGREMGGGVGSATGNPDAGRSAAETLEQLNTLQQTPGPASAAIEQKLLHRKKEDLGTKEIEGFTASGTRFSNTTPAGEIGNEKPMVSMTETWWSEDLKAALAQVHDDPLSGRRRMQLTNIQLGEPDAQLFQIPSDYKVQEFPVTSKAAGQAPQ